MNTIPELLDLAKNRNSLKSDRELARRLDLTAVHAYRTKGVIPDDTTALKLADLCGLPPEQVLITCHLAKAESGAVHEVWNKVLKMAVNACFVLIMGAGIMAHPAQACAGAVHSQHNNNIHYATLIMAALLLALAFTLFAMEGTL